MGLHVRVYSVCVCVHTCVCVCVCVCGHGCNSLALPCSVMAITPVKTVSSLPDDFWNIDEEGGVAGPVRSNEDDEFGPMDVDKGEPNQADSERVKQESSHDQGSGQSDAGMEVEGGQLEEDTLVKIVSCLEELRECIERAHQTIVSARSWPQLLNLLTCVRYQFSNSSGGFSCSDLTTLCMYVITYACT